MNPQVRLHHDILERYRLARALVPGRGPRIASAAILALTAVLSALINLDVAVVVAMPVAMGAAQRQRLPTDRLAIAVAMTANATSFLLPTSNITNLLLLSHGSLATPAYIGDSWLPWMLVTVVTLGPLIIWAGHTAPSQAHAVAAGPSARAVFDLIPMFLIASGIRALLGTGLALHGSFTSQLADGSALASAANNLPAAAALLPNTAAGSGQPSSPPPLGPTFSSPAQ
jgi:Na+/H+ antiporter NhaD/arsenite permease-like protein